MSKKDETSIAGEALRSIESELADRGLTLRRPTLDDMPTLFELQCAAFPERRPEELTNDVTLYRLIEFGNSVVSVDGSEKIRAYHMVFLSNNEEKTAVSGALVVHGSSRGRDIGTLLYRHSLWRSMIGGARVFRGTVVATNFSSLAALLNKGGAVCDRFHPRMGPYRIHRLRFGCPLSIGALHRPPIEITKLVEFAKSSVAGLDYQLVAPDDVEGLEAMYRETPMRILAVVPPGVLDEETVLFSLPEPTLEAVRAELGRGDPR